MSTPAFVQTVQGHKVLSITTASGQVAGDDLILGVSIEGTVAITSVSGGGATWSLIQATNLSTTMRSEVWIGSNCSAGATTITISGPSAANIDIIEVAEYSGVATTFPVETSGSNAATAVSPASATTSG